MVKALANALSTLIAMGTFSGPTKALNTRARIMKSGAPGGWPTSSL